MAQKGYNPILTVTMGAWLCAVMILGFAAIKASNTGEVYREMAREQRALKAVAPVLPNYMARR